MPGDNPYSAPRAPIPPSTLGFQSFFWPALLASALAAALWHFFPSPARYTELFDGDQTVYIIGLFAVGVISASFFPRPVWAHYLGSVFGQVIYALFALPLNVYLFLTFAFIALHSLVVWLSAFVASRTRFGIVQFLRGA